MSVASANVFALLDDEGTVDVGELAAKIPVAAKEAPVKKSDDGKFVLRSESSASCRRAGSSCKCFSLGRLRSLARSTNVGRCVGLWD